MSNENSAPSSDSDDLSTTGLIATRAKRSTAGNLYATLRQNLDDEELQKELLAEDEEDAGDYEGSGPDGDDDEAMDSSSDDDDAGPTKEGDPENLDGEKELQKAERAEAKKRKRMEAAKMRIPGWQKRSKRVKLADDVKAEDGSSERPKKKSERVNWHALDGVRQSSRASAVQNRELTHASLKQSAERSEKQKRHADRALEREQLKKRTDLTQEDRIAKAMRVEKETAKELGRWEREEAERQRIREEQLAAKRKRGIDGPVQKYWSGSALWEGEVIKIPRLHGYEENQVLQEDEGRTEADTSTTESGTIQGGFNTLKFAGSVLHAETCDGQNEVQRKVPENVSREVSAKEFVSVTDTSAPEQIEVANVGARPAQELQLLDGIHAYANEVPPLAKPPSTSSTAFQTNLGASQPYFPSSPELHVALACIHEIPQSAKFGTQTPQILGRSGDLPGQHQFPTAPTQHAEPLIPSIPLVKEQAQRSLLILEQYRSLEQSTSSRRSAKNNAKDTVGDPSLLSSTMAPDAYPTFDSEQSRYLTGKMRKRGTEQLLPPAPVKARCALSGWPAKFRDPRTGLPYADLQTYKLIQRIIAGGCSWSGLLGAWVGPAYGDMGRPAKGVPEGFGLSPQRQDAPSAGIKAEM